MTFSLGFSLHVCVAMALSGREELRFFDMGLDDRLVKVKMVVLRVRVHFIIVLIVGLRNGNNI